MLFEFRVWVLIGVGVGFDVRIFVGVLPIVGALGVEAKVLVGIDMGFIVGVDLELKLKLKLVFHWATPNSGWGSKCSWC